MAFSISMPHTASGWAGLPRDLVHEFRETWAERPVKHPEMSQDERAHRLAMEGLMRERSNNSMKASAWPR